MGYFGVRSDNEEAIVCQKCHRAVVAKNSNTSNLITHLRVNHPALYDDCRQAMEQKSKDNESLKPKSRSSAPVSPLQPTMLAALARSQPYDRKGKRWAKLTNAVTYCLAKDSLPIQTVERLGFTALLKEFDSRYQIPSRKYFSQTALPSLYSTTKEKVTGELKQVKFFSATTDLWSSIGLKPYMSYTLHYIDSHWTLQTRCLQTHFFS